jgi:hypothetical protein
MVRWIEDRRWILEVRRQETLLHKVTEAASVFPMKCYSGSLLTIYYSLLGDRFGDRFYCFGVAELSLLQIFVTVFGRAFLVTERAWKSSKKISFLVSLRTRSLLGESNGRGSIRP